MAPPGAPYIPVVSAVSGELELGPTSQQDRYHIVGNTREKYSITQPQRMMSGHMNQVLTTAKFREVREVGAAVINEGNDES